MLEILNFIVTISGPLFVTCFAFYLFVFNQDEKTTDDEPRKIILLDGSQNNA